MNGKKSRAAHDAWRISLLAILLLAALLRFYRLDAQSLWNDEGNSARLSERPVDLIIAGTASDIHPPGYYLLLHYWRALFGSSEFALRALSAVAGLFLVLFTYRLGQRLFGERTGLAAAFLGAISPFAVYYSQEARMYALLGALSAASTLLLVRLLSSLQSPLSNGRVGETASGRTTTAILYVLAAAAGLYTHYAFPFILLVHNLIVAVWWLVVARRPGRPRWRWLAMWGGTQAAVAALYLPWLPIALDSVTGWRSAGQAHQPLTALANVLRWLSVGHTLPLAEGRWALIGFGLLLLIGLWPRKGRWFSVISLALCLLAPVGLMFALDLYKPAWLKFLIVALPPFHLLVAHGIVNLRSLVPSPQSPVFNLRSLVSMLLLALTALVTFPSLHNLYVDPAYARDDYRQIASDIAAAAPDAEAAVILNAPNQWEVFTYYYPDRDVYPAPYHPDPAQGEAFLSPLAEQYDRVYVLYWGDAESDPQRRIERWLAAHAYKVDDRWYGRVRLSTYGTAPLPQAPTAPLDGGFGEHIHLRGYALPDESIAPGDVLPVTLFWQTQHPIGEPYKVTVQLLDQANRLIAQHDGQPGAGFAPTTDWQPQQTVIDRHGIRLPDGLPAGSYPLVVAVYHPATGERLPVTRDGKSTADYLVLADIEIEH